MRAIAYLGAIVGLVLAIATLTMSHSLASDGRAIGSLMRQRDWKIEAVDDTHQRAMVTSSVESVTSRAEALGLSHPARILIVDEDANSQ